MTSKPPGWPWRLNDERPQGWFELHGTLRFGPLPRWALRRHAPDANHDEIRAPAPKPGGVWAGIIRPPQSMM
ncbi:MAG: hypothetical protein BroJett013_06970 [Alphaproteobacteria bacterium]|nr:MAG: hypothetical protein BroJett013_06970 [Alphaproteobacteria bacterium]